MQQVHQALGAHDVVLHIGLPDEDPVLDALGHNQVPHPSHAVHIIKMHLQGTSDRHRGIYQACKSRGKLNTVTSHTKDICGCSSQVNKPRVK